MSNGSLFSPLFFANSFNLMKNNWNRNVSCFKSMVLSFEKYKDVSRRDLFGAELPQINILIQNATIQLMNNLYDTSRLSLKYKSALYNSSPDVQQALDVYSNFIYRKTLSRVTNFTTALKQFIEDSYVLGFGTMLALPRGGELSFITIKPEDVEFDVDPVTKVPNRFYITQEFDVNNPLSHVFQEIFKVDAPKVPINNEMGTYKTVDSYDPSRGSYYRENPYNQIVEDALKLGDESPDYIQNSNWVIRTWRRTYRHYSYNNIPDIKGEYNPHLNQLGNFRRIANAQDYYIRGSNLLYGADFIDKAGSKNLYYSYTKEDFELDYCPLIYIRFNVKSGEVIGLGRGLECMAMIEESKHINNALRVAGINDIDKTLLTTSTNLTRLNGKQVDTVRINNNTSKAVMSMKEVEGANIGQRLIPLDLGSNPTITFYLINTMMKSLAQNFEIDKLIDSNPNEMTATEIQVRENRDKRFIDVLVNEFKITFDLIFRLFFKHYMPEFQKLHKSLLSKRIDNIPDVSVIKNWVKDVFTDGFLEVQFLTNTEREVALQQITDFNQMADLQTKIAQIVQISGIDPAKARESVNAMFADLGLSSFNLFQNVEEPITPSANEGVPFMDMYRG